ncbi:peptidoglycan-binding protein [Calothrix sp. CCY 0018]|uniref:peptidoglycan-binding protein n=1 Tax=Calothrix sp. CCY 0018 TaxID=3103864 RepID=UPI0039C63B41
MRRCHYSIVIFTYLSCFGFNINPAVAVSYEKTPSLLKVAQADSDDTTSRSNLRIGSVGDDVKVLQAQLKKLGYYNGIPDGQFRATTRIAVIEFQQKKGLLADGIAGSQTREVLKTATLEKSSFTSTPSLEPVSEETPEEQKSSSTDWIKLAFIAMGILAGAGTLFYLFQLFRYSKRAKNPGTYANDDLDDDTEIVQPPQYEFTDTDRDQKYLPTSDVEDIPPTITPSAPIIPTEKTSRLAKVNVVDELIEDLESSNPTLRRKAIWELGQKGDSRAIQPLVEQMVDADSQQRSLILAALSEIGTRTLKPMNRALAVSMQDESPDVRKNAIRDLTRVYDVMAQISQMLSMAAEDEDPEVQETARYAISQMNRIRILPSEGTQTRVQHPEKWEDSEQ